MTKESQVAYSAARDADCACDSAIPNWHEKIEDFRKAEKMLSLSGLSGG
jgi:hypothetical protein